jgi:hypothetical protein
VVKRFKARVYGLSLPGIESSNPAGGHGCLSLVSVVCCQVERSLRQTDHSSGGVLPAAVVSPYV